MVDNRIVIKQPDFGKIIFDEIRVIDTFSIYDTILNRDRVKCFYLTRNSVVHLLIITIR